jgi:hypothetical protein
MESTLSIARMCSFYNTKEAVIMDVTSEIAAAVRAVEYLSLPVPRRNEVSQLIDTVGHLRPIDDVRRTSAHTPIADMAALGATVERGQQETNGSAAKLTVSCAGGQRLLPRIRPRDLLSTMDRRHR